MIAGAATAESNRPGPPPRISPVLSASGSDALGAELDSLLLQATFDVRPSNYAIRFYNAVGRLPLRLGAVLMLSTSLDGLRVVWQAGIRKRTDAALQVLYTYRLRPWRLLWAVGDHLWQSSFNTRSVRSRGRFVQTAVASLLGRLAAQRACSGAREQITAASLGSGSACQFLAGAAANGFGEGEIALFLVDRDPRALCEANQNAQAAGLEGAVQTREASIGAFLDTTSNLDLVEMVGLADYFQDEQLQKYLCRIASALTTEGFFLGANISSREEMYYAHGAACWPAMQYRTTQELISRLKQAGFSRIWTGGCGLYTVWVAQKS